MGQRNPSPTVKQQVRNLRKYTGQDFGWLEAADKESRLAAAAKWREWYDANKAHIRWNQKKYMYEVLPE